MTSRRVTLTFLGAAGTVTGSKFLLTVGDRKILVDCGMFQGEKKWRLKNWEGFGFDPAELDAVVLTHAHMDHSGMLPALVRDGFNGPIYATGDTIRLAEIVLLDSANLQEREARYANERGYSKHDPAEPLYVVDDVQRTVKLFKRVPFDEPVDLGDAVRAEFTHAGHILGSASVWVGVEGTSVLFSGDLGRRDHPLLKPRGNPPAADHVVIESTYGDRRHSHPKGPAHELMAETIRRTIGRGGSVLIPAFAIDRTEVVLKALSEMMATDRIPTVPVYVNSPMALAALAVYHDAAAEGELRDGLGDDWITIPELRAVKTSKESKTITNPKRPCIIIASSGMATGGRVVHHLEAMLPNPKHSVILTGYQAFGTRGRSLADGARQLKMFGQYVPVQAEIVKDTEFSVHADVDDLLDWLRGLGAEPRTVFVVHGENQPAGVFADRVRADLGWTTAIPQYQEVVMLRAAATRSG